MEYQMLGNLDDITCVSKFVLSVGISTVRELRQYYLCVEVWYNFCIAL